MNSTEIITHINNKKHGELNILSSIEEQPEIEIMHQTDIDEEEKNLNLPL